MSQTRKDIESLVKKIRHVLMEHEDILLAYLFGSCIHNQWTKINDIDIGVYVTEKGLQNPWFPIELQEELSKKIRLDHPFDVRILNGASPKFLFEVVYRTQKIWIRDEKLRIEFETHSLIEWYDMRITIENFRRERAAVLLE